MHTVSQLLPSPPPPILLFPSSLSSLSRSLPLTSQSFLLFPPTPQPPPPPPQRLWGVRVSKYYSQTLHVAYLGTRMLR